MKEELYYLPEDPLETRNIAFQRKELTEAFREILLTRLTLSKREKTKYKIKRKLRIT